MSIERDASIKVLTEYDPATQFLKLEQKGDSVALAPELKSNLSLGRRIQAFFGFGPFKLKAVTKIIDELVKESKEIADPATLNKTIEALNGKIRKHNKFGLRKFFTSLQIHELHKVGEQVAAPPNIGSMLATLQDMPKTQAKALPQEARELLVLGDKLTVQQWKSLLSLIKDLVPHLSKEALQEKFGEGQFTILHLACRFEIATLVKEIAKREDFSTLIDDQRDSSLNTPLYTACFSTSEDMAQDIMQNVSNEQCERLLIEKNSTGDTPLRAACINKSESILKAICEKIEPEKFLAIFTQLERDSQGKNLLHYILRTGNEKIADMLFTKIPPSELERLFFEKDIYDNTPLHDACFAGNDKAIKVLLKVTPQELLAKLLVTPGPQGFTPFQYACSEKAGRVVAELLNHVQLDRLKELLLQTPQNSNPPLVLAYQNPGNSLTLILEKVKKSPKLLLELLLQENDQHQSVVTLAIEQNDTDFLAQIIEMFKGHADLKQQLQSYIDNYRSGIS